MALLDSIFFKALGEALRWRGREIGCGAALLVTASCVPLQAAPAPVDTVAEAATLQPALAPQPEPMVLRDVAPTEASRINASIPFSAEVNPRAPSTVFQAAGPSDQFRSLQCLAEAIYYEARSESEDGQRAVAQVVLNRVRHPAWPGSVCGVVYQGPLRAGGGCQFTFTCDGALLRIPYGADWARARRIAAEALAGQVFAPVGLATNYHTHQVLPDWAFRLPKTTVIGNHIFYRLPGAWGGASAFNQAYRGREPSPATVMAARLPINLGRGSRAVLPPPPVNFASLPLPVPVSAYAAPTANLASEAPPPSVNDRLPQSTVKAEFANSGRYLSDIPPAAPGR
ncbi:MAG TPA: cell wall hydrolase [Allosphingosinicella sp.]|nr:cell wall hydrolase [Allosphingosinicella sp.]